MNFVVRWRSYIREINGSLYRKGKVSSVSALFHHDNMPT